MRRDYLPQIAITLCAMIFTLGGMATVQAQDGVIPPPEVVGEKPSTNNGTNDEEPKAETIAPVVDKNPDLKEVPDTPKEAAESVSLLISAAKSGQWSIFAGLLIMLLIFVGNRMGLREKVGKKALPWVSVGLGVLASIGVMLAAGVAWDEALIQGLVAGLSASGFWELIGKHLLRKDTA